MAFFAGVLLGLSMILPIGPQNIFVLSQGLLGGWRQGLTAAVITGLCDTVLILAGGAGLSSVISSWPLMQRGMLGLGSAFLVYLGINALFGDSKDSEEIHQSVRSESSLMALIYTGVGVSWGNPHAILDNVVVLGSAITAQDETSRMAFAAGAIAASWLFFALLATVGALFGANVGKTGRLWAQKISGLLMLFFAAMLGYKAIVVIQ